MRPTTAAQSRVKAMKIAAFQINLGNGAVYLVCVPTSSFRTACDLESWLCANVQSKCDVKFLGRFDQVRTLKTLEEMEGLSATDLAAGGLLGTVVSIEACEREPGSTP
jgi:hypothetical protein